MAPYYEPLRVPTHLQGKAGLKIRPRGFFSMGLTARAHCLVAQMTTRDAIPDGVWGDNPARRQVAKAVGEIMREWHGWPNAHFLPDDPFGLVFDASITDSLDYVEVLMEIEELLAVELDEQLCEKLHSMTFGQVVDCLLEKCPGGLAALKLLPREGEDALESRTCPSLAAFLDLRAFLKRHGVQPRNVRPSTPIADVVRECGAGYLDSYARRRFGVRGVWAGTVSFGKWFLAGLVLTLSLTACVSLFCAVMFVVGTLLHSEIPQLSDVVFDALPFAVFTFGAGSIVVTSLVLKELRRRLRYGRNATFGTVADLVRWIVAERARLVASNRSGGS